MCSISRRCSPLPDVQTSIRIASYPPKNWRQQRSSSALEGLLFACMPHTSRQHNTSSPSYKDGGRAEPQRKTGFGKRCKRNHEVPLSRLLRFTQLFRFSAIKQQWQLTPGAAIVTSRSGRIEREDSYTPSVPDGQIHIALSRQTQTRATQDAGSLHFCTGSM